MAVYLIDFENVTSAGISGIQRLSKEDKVYIFYTVNASNMSFAAHMNLLSSPAEVIYYNVTSGGKNALDFQLASFLGYLISNSEDKDFYIISNDKGYDHVKNFWERSGIAEGVTIHSSPSINRSLIPIEKPFTSKIQQSPQGAKQTVTQQGGLSLERLEQMKAETEKYAAQKKAAETAAKSANQGNTNEKTEKTDENVETENTNSGKKQSKSANGEKETAKNESVSETTEGKPVKRRGRPRKQDVEASEKKAEKSAKTDEISEKAKKSAAKKEKETQSDAKLTAKKSKTNAAKGKSSAKTENDSDVFKNALRPLLAKAKVKSEDEVNNVANYFRLADGKQQFYRSLITLYGMERGVEIYRVIRSEYTNLTKLVKP